MAVIATWTVDHVVLAQVEKCAIRMRKLSANRRIEVIAVEQSVPPLEDEEDVCMRQTPLLPLNGHQIAVHLTEHALFDELVHQPLQPQLKHPRHYIRAVVGSLPRKQRLLDLLPLRILCRPWTQQIFFNFCHVIDLNK